MVGAAPSVPLKDVEWRLDSEPKEGDRGTRARFVPHINARTAAALMDEWVGPTCWADEYRTVTIAGKEAILCTVSVWDGERWVSKQDVGVPSHTEAQKGGISDAFKRTVTVKWGAGRNVYELPTLWAPCKSVSGRDGKVRGYANEQTLPDLLRQLKHLGFDADGCHLEDGASDEHADAASGSTAVPTADGTSERATPAPSTRGPSAPSRSVLGRAPEAEKAGPVSSGPASSPNRLGKLKSRVSALVAAKVSVADERTRLRLPKLDDKCSVADLDAWDALLSDLEATMRPFEAAS